MSFLSSSIILQHTLMSLHKYICPQTVCSLSFFSVDLYISIMKLRLPKVAIFCSVVEVIWQLITFQGLFLAVLFRWNRGDQRFPWNCNIQSDKEIPHQSPSTLLYFLLILPFFYWFCLFSTWWNNIPAELCIFLLCLKMPKVLFPLPLFPNNLYLWIKTFIVMETQPLNLCLLFEFLPVGYHF